MRPIYFLLYTISFLVLALTGCKKDDDPEPEEKKPKITCSSGCSTMSWGVEGETGSITEESDCTRVWQGNNYIETCNGTRTYSVSGNAYTYKAIYDWINCEISIEIGGVGSCSD